MKLIKLPQEVKTGTVAFLLIAIGWLGMAAAFLFWTAILFFKRLDAASDKLKAQAESDNKTHNDNG